MNVTSFKTGNPSDWVAYSDMLAAGKPYVVLPVLNGQRACNLTIFSLDDVVVLLNLVPDYPFGVNPDTLMPLPNPETGEVVPQQQAKQFPIGIGRGFKEMSFTIERTAFVSFIFLTEHNTEYVWFKPEARTQEVAGVAEESFTTIEPRGVRDPNLDRIMMTAAINDAMRAAQFQQELANLYDQFGEPVEAPQTAPPAPAADGEGSGGDV